MKNWREFFKKKKITVIGLGLLGRGLGDAIFLAEHGAELIVTDLRDEKTLAPSLAKLERYKDIRYTFGGHKLEDFRKRDFILKAAGVPLDSPYIAEARKNKIPIKMDASLFAKLMPKGIILVGVTGTRGKSTTTALIYEILKERFKIYDLRFKNRKKPKDSTTRRYLRRLPFSRLFLTTTSSITRETASGILRIKRQFLGIRKKEMCSLLESRLSLRGPTLHREICPPIGKREG